MIRENTSDLQKLIFVCLLSLNVYTIQYLIEGAYANSFEIQKVNNNQSIESTEKIIKIKRV